MDGSRLILNVAELELLRRLVGERLDEYKKRCDNWSKFPPESSIEDMCFDKDYEVFELLCFVWEKLRALRDIVTATP